THVAACTLARSPIRDTLIEGFSHFVTSMTAPIASGGSESPGGACTHWKAPPCHGARGKETFVKARVNGEVAPQPIVRRTRGAGGAPAESGHLAALRCCPDQQPVVAVSITVLSARRSVPTRSANERDARQHVS